LSFIGDWSRPLSDLDSARALAGSRDDCTGRLGVIGFCLGGGFALVLASGHGFSAASVNYGASTTTASAAYLVRARSSRATASGTAGRGCAGRPIVSSRY
jgi:dienelactone hydrolase